MAQDELRNQQQMNEALDHALSEEEIEALHARIAESEGATEEWDQLRKTDAFLRQTPMVEAPAGFAERVMAAIAALPLPGFARKNLSVGIALGLLVAGLFTIPVLSIVLIIILSVITNPAAVQAFAMTLFSTAGYIISLTADIVTQTETRAAGSPVMIALVTTMIPLTILWGWLIWNLIGGGRGLSRRSKS
jgi:hypothetical protein